MDPATAQIIANLAATAAKPVALAVKGKHEKAEDADIESEGERLSGGAGVMSPSELAAAKAELAAQTQARQNELLANLARGPGAGSGTQGTQIRDVYKTTLGGNLRGLSDIRSQNLAGGAAAQQALQMRRLAAIDRGTVRKDKVLAATDTGDLTSLGQQQREGQGQTALTGADTATAALKK